MAIHGKATGVLLGEFDPTRYFTDMSLGRSLDTHDSSGFMADDKEYTSGMNDSTFSASGFYQGVLSNVEEDFEDHLGDGGADMLYLIVLGGWAIGSRSYIGQCLGTGFDITAPVADLVSTSFTMQGQPGLRGATIVLPHVEATGDLNGASLDNLASTPDGGVVQVHVTANSLDDTTVVTLQHPTDDSVWVDLQEFTTIAAATGTSERFTIAGSINRYTRVIIETSGTGQIVVTAALARN